MSNFLTKFYIILQTIIDALVAIIDVQICTNFRQIFVYYEFFIAIHRHKFFKFHCFTILFFWVEPMLVKCVLPLAIFHFFKMNMRFVSM
jgi:hypothetical protein